MKMNPVVHFEMPAEDRKRMIEFYAKTFGWEANQLGPEMGNYVVVMTAESDKNGPLEKGRINGGFYDRFDKTNAPSIVIAVDDVKEHKQKVIDAGGKFLGGQGAEFDDIPGVGLYASFVDTEGNRVGVLQPSGDMGGTK